jgi:DNA anti-recombination protein RmuC
MTEDKDRLIQHEGRITALERNVGVLLKWKEEDQDAHTRIIRELATLGKASQAVVDKVSSMHETMRSAQATQERFCNLRHDPLDRRVARIETHEDDDEGPDTGIMDRPTLVTNKHDLEKQMKELVEQVQDLVVKKDANRNKALISVGVTLATIAAAVASHYMGIPQ